MFEIKIVVNSCDECPYMLHIEGMADRYHCSEFNREIPVYNREQIQDWCEHNMAS